MDCTACTRTSTYCISQGKSGCFRDWKGPTRSRINTINSSFSLLSVGQVLRCDTETSRCDLTNAGASDKYQVNGAHCTCRLTGTSQLHGLVILAEVQVQTLFLHTCRQKCGMFKTWRRPEKSALQMGIATFSRRAVNLQTRPVCQVPVVTLLHGL